MNDKEMLFKISLLISKSLSGDITKEEQTELDSWREKSEYAKNSQKNGKIWINKVSVWY